MPFIKGNRLWDNSKTKETWFKKGHHPENEFQEGHTSWLKGKKGYHLADLNPEWKGDDVGYRGLHKWVERHLGKPSTCEGCGKTNLSGHLIHWANKSKNYKRLITDWVRLCTKCHGAFDKTGTTSVLL